MGRHTYTDVVPFVAHSVFTGDDFHPPEDRDLQTILSPDGYMACEFDWQEYPPKNAVKDKWGDLKLPPPNVKGWQYIDEIFKIGKKGNIYADKWTKGDFVVYLVNEDPYSNGGGIDLAVISDNENSIKEFCKEFGFKDPKIEETDAVQWTC